MYQLATPAFAEIDVKKSIFIGQLYPIRTRAEALQKLSEIRAQHPNAVHVCWALLCDGDSGLDDDGEPSGTAAKPIYNVLVHKQLHHVLAVVVRYWGGSKLGAGGLTRAYGQAISDAFKTAQLLPIEILCERQYRIQFSDESSIRRLCEQLSVQILNADYGDKVTLNLRLPLNQVNAFHDQAFNLLKGALEQCDSSLVPQ